MNRKFVYVGDKEIKVRRYTACKKAAEALIDEYGISDKSKEEQVNVLVGKCVDIYNKIEEQNDKLNSDLADEAKVNFNIEKSNFTEFVRFYTMLQSDKVPMIDKISDKVYKQINKIAKKFNAKLAFYEGYFDHQNVDTLVKSGSEEDTVLVNSEINSDFVELLDRGTDIQFIINRYKEQVKYHAKAVEYISDFVIENKDFNTLVELQYSMNQNDKINKSTPKFLKSCLDFVYNYNLLKKYGFDTNIEKCFNRVGIDSMKSTLDIDKIKKVKESVKLGGYYDDTEELDEI